MELATIQSTTDFKASWHSLDERPQKKGVCEDSLISRTFKLLLEVDLSRVLSLFQTHPQSTLKPQPSRSVLSWKKGGGVRATNDATQYHNDKRGKGEGLKEEVTRSALAVPVLYSLSIPIYSPIITYLSMFSLLQSLSGTYRSPSLVIPIPVMFHSILRRGRLQKLLWE